MDREDGAALFVPANTAHQRMPGDILTLYIDPTTDEARAIRPVVLLRTNCLAVAALTVGGR
jgi:hypothetical protein